MPLAQACLAIASSSFVGLLLIGPCDPATAQPSAEPFGIVPGSFELSPSSTEAGAHADLSITVEFAHGENGRTFNDLRAAEFELPAGFIGNARAVPSCTQADFLAGDLVAQCPPPSQVGTVDFDGHIGDNELSATLPLYILDPAQPGVPAELGFRFLVFAQRVVIGVRPQDGGLAISVDDVSVNLEPRRVMISIWGTPAAAAHDPERGRRCLGLGVQPSCEGGGEAAGVQPTPFLANPTGCGPARAELRASSWEEPASSVGASAEVGPIGGCEAVPFEPELEARASSGATDSSSGFTVSLGMPGDDWSDPDAISSSAIRNARVVLPQGFSLNPAFIAGLTACTSARMAEESPASAPGEGCPDASKIGSVEARSPLLGEPAKGGIYLAEPFENPTGARFAVYAIAKAPSAGVQIEMPARLELDPQSGRPTVAIEGAPQLPLSSLVLSLGAGPIGPLVTPSTCGSFEVRAELTPYSAPAEPSLLAERLSVGQGPGGTPCPIGALPFHPDLAAASSRRRAGGFSPLRIRIGRNAGEARIDAVSLRLPPGLSARLGGVAVCPEAALPASCPRQSLLGRTLVEAGAGPVPARLPGHLYLAGPYAGSPLSVVLVTPARLGPFDLGALVLREPLRLNPRSGALILGSFSARLPTAIDGFPLHLRGLELVLDRPRLVRNPTSCLPLATSALLAGSDDVGGAQAAALSAPYRVEGCRRLRFAPTLRLTMLGTTARNGHPGLRAVFASHAGEANLASASISLPPDLLFDFDRLGAICADRDLDACPPRTIVGRVRAISPLLAEPLEGRVYLRRAPQAGLPDVVVDLGNPMVDLHVTERLRIGPAGVRIVTKAAPDVPISKLVLVIAGGARGLLVYSRGFCRGWRQVDVTLRGHNGQSRKLRPRLSARCPARHSARERRRMR